MRDLIKATQQCGAGSSGAQQLLGLELVGGRTKFGYIKFSYVFVVLFIVFVRKVESAYYKRSYL